MSNSKELGTERIPRILAKMAIPASVGFLIMNVYFIVDTIFVGRWVGALGIAAITVVMPISFLVSSIGMAIGVGGASVISRALGSDDEDHACRTFGNMVSLTVILVFLLMALGFIFEESILLAFGAKGDILPYAKTYFEIILFGSPFLAWAMMSNNVMRAEGEPNMAMLVMMIPAVVNLILDPIFIVWFEWGMAGAAWATAISYVMSAGFSLWFFLSGRSEIKIFWSSLRLKLSLIKQISSIGSVTLARQGTISLLSIVLNQSLFTYGGEIAVAAFGIVNRTMMFANFPVLGITQGFLPIAGYNYGAQKFARVKDIIWTAVRAGTVIAGGLFVLVLLFPEEITRLFTTEGGLIEMSSKAMVLIFLATPLLTLQLIGSAYFQAIGKALPALLLTLTKQGFFLIPLVLILPIFFDLNGIWYAFPVSDILAAAVTYWYLRREIRKTIDPYLEVEQDAQEAVLAE